MKVCPICQSTYDDGVDFCFKDGAPLEAQSPAETPDSVGSTDFSGLTEDDLDAPDAISLTGRIPVATDEDELATLPMSAEQPPSRQRGKRGAVDAQRLHAALDGTRNTAIAAPEHALRARPSL